MSFNDFTHLLHKCNIVDRRDGTSLNAELGDKQDDPIRKVFQAAHRGSLPGNSKVNGRQESSQTRYRVGSSGSHMSHNIDISHKGLYKTYPFADSTPKFLGRTRVKVRMSLNQQQI